MSSIVDVRPKVIIKIPILNYENRTYRLPNNKSEANLLTQPGRVIYTVMILK